MVSIEIKSAVSVSVTPIESELRRVTAEVEAAAQWTVSLNLSRVPRAGLSGFGLDVETVDPVCIHARSPDTVG